MTPKKLTITRMDPSCTVGFYIRDAAEFKKFVQEVREVCVFDIDASHIYLFAPYILIKFKTTFGDYFNFCKVVFFLFFSSDFECFIDDGTNPTR